MHLQTVREALATQIQARVARSFNVDAYPGTNQQYPQITVMSGAPYVTYHLTFGDRCLTGVEFDIEVVTVAADGRSAWLVMDDVLSPGAVNLSSIMQAVEYDATLGGTVGQAWVSAVTSGPAEDEFGRVVAVLACHVTANRI